MSCGENPEASMASDEGAGTPDERQRTNLASLNLRELVGELSLLAHAAATGEHYDADRLNALTDALRAIGRGERVVRDAISKRRKGRRN
eukprot:5161967-Pleurochrysis_carterae.AAC.2